MDESAIWENFVETGKLLEAKASADESAKIALSSMQLLKNHDVRFIGERAKRARHS